MKAGQKIIKKLLNKNGEVVDTLTFIVDESGASDYGNRTCTEVTATKWNIPMLFDTRYFTGSNLDFVAWFYENKINKDFIMDKETIIQDL